jgi:hypothetical protein
MNENKKRNIEKLLNKFTYSYKQTEKLKIEVFWNDSCIYFQGRAFQCSRTA